MGSSCSGRAASGVTPDSVLTSTAFEPWKALPQSRRIRVLDRWPDGMLFEPWSPDEAPDDAREFLRGKPVPIGPLFAGKRTVIVGMPAAFAPNCSRVHLPQFVLHAVDFFAAGVDQIVVMVANDPCVVQAWSDANHARAAGVRIMSDRNCDVARSTGLAFDARGEVSRVTVRRFCALLEDGVVKLIRAEPDGLGVTCSAAIPLLREVREKSYEAALGPKHRWERPPGAQRSRSLPPEASAGNGSSGSYTALGSGRKGGGGGGKPPAGARVNASARSMSSTPWAGSGPGSASDKGSVQSRGSRSYQDFGSNGSSTYYNRYRLAGDAPAPAGTLVGLARVPVQVVEAPASQRRQQPPEAAPEEPGSSRGGVEVEPE